MSDSRSSATAVVTSDAQVSTNGLELAYSEVGTGAPLVLIMGLGADRSAWEQHVTAFAGSYRCFAVDNRGAGRSDAPAGPYTTAQMADDYAGLITGLGLQSARVIGISMGGAIAQQLALRHPELVTKLVLVSSWARAGVYTAEVFAQLRNGRAALAPADFTRLLQLLIWSPTSFDEKADDLVGERDTAPGMSVEAFLAQCDACVGHDVVDRLTDIAVPTLVTAGSRDVFTPIELSEELADLIPGAELLVYEGAGHAHHWERLEEFNAAVLRWLA